MRRGGSGGPKRGRRVAVYTNKDAAGWRIGCGPKKFTRGSCWNCMRGSRNGCALASRLARRIGIRAHGGRIATSMSLGAETLTCTMR